MHAPPSPRSIGGARVEAAVNVGKQQRQDGALALFVLRLLGAAHLNCNGPVPGNEAGMGWEWDVDVFTLRRHVSISLSAICVWATTTTHIVFCDQRVGNHNRPVKLS